MNTSLFHVQKNIQEPVKLIRCVWATGSQVAAICGSFIMTEIRLINIPHLIGV